MPNDITPTQAAEILNVSRGYVIRRINDGVIPARKVGSHHRIRFDDVLAFKTVSDAEADKAMDKLVAIEQELGLE